MSCDQGSKGVKFEKNYIFVILNSEISNVAYSSFAKILFKMKVDGRIVRDIPK